MKKILAVALTLMLIPFSAFGLEMLQDSAMDEVTGQAGVSINVDVRVDATIGTAAWGDADGVDGTNGGWVGLSDMDIDNLRVRAREDWALSGDNDMVQALHFFTVDVGTGNSTYGADTTYVRINPGDFQISMEHFSATVGLGGLTAGDDPVLGEVMGTMFMDGMEVYIGGYGDFDNDPATADTAYENYIDIMAHGGSGVTIAFDMLIDEITIVNAGWGDLDGLENTVAYNVTGATLTNYVNGDYTDGGWIGVNNLAMDDLLTSGTAQIDVVTLDTAAIGADLLALAPIKAQIDTAQDDLDLLDQYTTDPNSDYDAADDPDGDGYDTDGDYMYTTNPAWAAQYATLMDLVTQAAPYQASLNTVAGLYGIWKLGNPNVSETFVHIQLDDIDVALASMSGTVVLGEVYPDVDDDGNDILVYDTPNGTLGQFYVGDVNATVNGWIDIFAH